MAFKTYSSRSLDQKAAVLKKSVWFAPLIYVLTTLKAFDTWASAPNPYNPLGSERIKYSGFSNSNYAKAIVVESAVAVLAIGVAAISSTDLVRVIRAHVVTLVSGVVIAATAVGGIVEIKGALVKLESAPITLVAYGVAIVISSIVTINRASKVGRNLIDRDLAARNQRNFNSGTLKSTVPVVNSSESAAWEIRALFDLKNAGALTEEEFERKKKQILGM